MAMYKQLLVLSLISLFSIEIFPGSGGFTPNDGAFPIRLKWSHHVSTQPEIGAFFEDYMFVKENNTALRAINIHTGSYEWSNDFASQIRDLKIYGRYINVITSNGKFYRIHPEKGSIMKAVSIENSVISNAIITGQDTILYSTADNMSIMVNLFPDITATNLPYKIDKIFSHNPPLFQANNNIYTLDQSRKSFIRLIEANKSIVTAGTDGDHTVVLTNNEAMIINNNEFIEPYKISFAHVYESFDITFHDDVLYMLGKREDKTDLLSIQIDTPRNIQRSPIEPSAIFNRNEYGYDSPGSILVTDEVIIIALSNELILLDRDNPTVISSVSSLPSVISAKPATYNSLLFVPEAGLINCYRGKNTIPPAVTLSYFYKDDTIQDGTEAVVISWVSPEKTITNQYHYDLQYTTGELRDISEVDPVSIENENKYIITNFESGFLQWRLRLNINGIYSPWSNTNLYLLPEGRHFSAPNPPEFINAIPTQNNSIILEFRPFDERTTYYYNIYYKKQNESWSDSILITKVEKSPFVIPHLDQFRGYEFGITSVDFYGNESVMNVIKAVPLPKITLNGRGGNRTLNKAIRKSDDGSNIKLVSGYYIEHVVIDKGIKISGISPKDTQLITYLNDPLVEIKTDAGSTVTMENLALIIQDNNTSAIKVTSGNLTIKNLLIIGNNNSTAIEVASPESKVHISHATIVDHNTAFKALNYDNIDISNSILSNNTMLTDGKPLKHSKNNSIANSNPPGIQTGLSDKHTPIFLQPARRLNYLVASESKTINASVIEKTGESLFTNLGAYGETPYAATKENNDLHKYIYIPGVTHVSSFMASQKTPGIDRINCYIMTPAVGKNDLIRMYNLNKFIVSSTIPGKLFNDNYLSTAPVLSSYINPDFSGSIRATCILITTCGKLLAYLFICTVVILTVRIRLS